MLHAMEERRSEEEEKDGAIIRSGEWRIIGENKRAPNTKQTHKIQFNSNN